MTIFPIENTIIQELFWCCRISCLLMKRFAFIVATKKHKMRLYSYFIVLNQGIQEICVILEKHITFLFSWDHPVLYFSFFTFIWFIEENGDINSVTFTVGSIIDFLDKKLLKLFTILFWYQHHRNINFITWEIIFY